MGAAMFFNKQCHKHDLTPHHWLETATRGLSSQACVQIEIEIGNHYRDCVEEALTQGMNRSAACVKAIAVLGNPRKARRHFLRTELTIRQQRRIETFAKPSPWPPIIFLFIQFISILIEQENPMLPGLYAALSTLSMIIMKCTGSAFRTQRNVYRALWIRLMASLSLITGLYGTALCLLPAPNTTLFRFISLLVFMSIAAQFHLYTPLFAKLHRLTGKDDDNSPLPQPSQNRKSYSL